MVLIFVPKKNEVNKIKSIGMIFIIIKKYYFFIFKVYFKFKFCNNKKKHYKKRHKYSYLFLLGRLMDNTNDLKNLILLLRFYVMRR